EIAPMIEAGEIEDVLRRRDQHCIEGEPPHALSHGGEAFRVLGLGEKRQCRRGHCAPPLWRLGLGARSSIAYCRMRLKLIEMWLRRMCPTASRSPISIAARMSAISRRKTVISSRRLRRGTDLSQMRVVR